MRAGLAGIAALTATPTCWQCRQGMGAVVASSSIATVAPSTGFPLRPPQFSLSLVVKESFKLYKAVSEGVINLADAFFEMEYYDASE